ncbi:MAG: hypothetical protein ABEK12_03675, partial [Candidatus Nanohaloarchaea archaeon]
MLHRFGFDASFHDVINVWQEDGWDEEYNTVLPETTTAYAKDAAQRFPRKRLIVHYMQPHYPFLDSSVKFDKRHLHREDSDTLGFWEEIFRGRMEVPMDEIWRLYRETLRQTLPHVEEAMTEIAGKVVVTSDHGNMVGERSFPIPHTEWGHPPRIYTPE